MTLFPELDQARQFLAMLTGSSDSRVCWQTYWDIPDARKRSKSEQRDRIRCFHATLDEALDRLVALQQIGAGVYIAVNDLGGQHRMAENVQAIRAHFIDVDGKREIPAAWPLPPTIVTQRDQTHWHAYWHCTDGDLQRFADLQHQLAAYWSSDPSVCDLPRVMRVPGFWHLKDPDNPILVRVVDTKPRSYSQDQIAAAHPVAEEKRYQPKTIIQTAETVGPSHRHNFLKTAVAKLRNVGLGPEEMRASLRAIIDSRFDLTDGRTFEDDELDDLIAWGMKRESGDAEPTLDAVAHGQAAADSLRAFFDAQDAELEAEVAQGKPEDPGPFPVDLMSPGGTIGRWMEWTEAQAMRQQPILTLGATLAAFGAVIGRKVQSQMGARSNLYCLGVAPTGAGKDNARVCNQIVLHHAGMATDPSHGVLGPEDIASDSGLVAAICAQPAILLQLDEIGRLLKTLASPGKAPHLYGVITVLLRLYTSAGALFLGKAYSDAKRNQSVNQPCCCLYGTTVPRSLYEGLTTESLSDGFMARLLIFPGADDPVEQVPMRGPPPDALVNEVRQWRGYDGDIGSVNPDPMVVERTEGAQAVFDDLRGFIRDQRKRLGDSVLGDLWTRCEEKADQVSLAIACSLHGRVGAVVDEDAASYGARLSVYLTRRMIHDCSESVGENEQEKRVLRVASIIRRAGRRGITRSMLTRKTQWLKAHERNDIIQTLLDGEVRSEERLTKGRTVSVYRMEGYI